MLYLGIFTFTLGIVWLFFFILYFNIKHTIGYHKKYKIIHYITLSLLIISSSIGIYSIYQIYHQDTINKDNSGEILQDFYY